MTISSKLPNNSIVSFDFATDLEEETDNEAELFNKAVQSTLCDLSTLVKSNKLVRLAWESTHEGVKLHEKLAEAEKEFEEE